MWGVLNVLDVEGAITQQSLGRSVGIDPSSMVATIDELESRGLVERRRHPSDRRAHALYLTEAGTDTLARDEHWPARRRTKACRVHWTRKSARSCTSCC